MARKITKPPTLLKAHISPSPYQETLSQFTLFID